MSSDAWFVRFGPSCRASSGPEVVCPASMLAIRHFHISIEDRVRTQHHAEKLIWVREIEVEQGPKRLPKLVGESFDHVPTRCWPLAVGRNTSDTTKGP